MSDAATEFKPNLEKLRKLESQHASIMIGGKGVPRRKKKIIHKTAVTDEKKLQSSLKKLTVNSIQGIEEVNMFKDSGEVLHFSNPKVQASLASNIFAISGQSETKPNTLKNAAEGAKTATGEPAIEEEDEDVPQLVENFEEASKSEPEPVPALETVVASEDVKIEEIN